MADDLQRLFLFFAADGVVEVFMQVVAHGEMVKALCIAFSKKCTDGLCKVLIQCCQICGIYIRFASAAISDGLGLDGAMMYVKIAK